ncbi:translation factor [Encephalitozoon hellem ATCC 50504]|uniref:Threonylcarbamoyl-AMP synthase n=1 Tax=Encephalitozoon hellem TaxID=27973 RepID=A0A9Q9C1R2_ENCHE|nr:translation factor [Encephalitozoon hellem ATCC 50504]AFM99056.1 translation factor [Encephalitozoon hellem ATCC 50504]UTX42461.1 tRNA threonylcarbamoyl adenosine modification protein [Encephalitozoon hellem]|eukprot:XP_003888037.1 translation factor [Encephalitozoon hellem ATCC 50504]
MRIVSIRDLDIDSVVKFFDDVVVVPTETVYGLAASIHNPRAVEKIFELKRRPADNPLIVHVSSEKMLEDVIEGPIPVEYKKLMDKFWPGPLSLLFKSKDNVNPVVRGGLDTIAVRMPRNEQLLKIIEKLGAPVAAPSANVSGRPSPTTVEHVVEDFGDRVGMIIDGGPCPVGVESTVVWYSDGAIQVLRPGGVGIEDIRSAVSCEVVMKNKAVSGEAVLSPGQKYKHYSPRSPLVLFKGKPREVESRILRYIEANPGVARIGVGLHSGMNIEVPLGRKVDVFNMGNDKREVCRNLFEGLRRLDKTSDVILIAGVDFGGEGYAIMDRLERAADDIIML